MPTLACLVAFDKRSAGQATGPITDLHNEDIASIVGGSEYFFVRMKSPGGLQIY